MRWLLRLVTWGVPIGIAAVIAFVIVRHARDHGPTGGFRTYALFQDASHLPVGSRVMTSGVQVGTISALGIDGRLARVSLRLRDEVAVYDTAWVERRQDTLFGDGYLELHPGEPGGGTRRLRSGERIPRVVEGASTDRTLRQLEQGMPVVQSAVARTYNFVLGLRRAVDGPFAAQVEALDRRIRDGMISEPIDQLAAGVDRLDRWTATGADATAGLAPRVNRALDTFADDVAGVTRDLRDGRQQVHDALADAREGIDKVDPYVADAAEILANLDGQGPPEDRGTLGTLINDPTLGEQIEDATEGVREAVGSARRLRSTVRLRAEAGLFHGQTRVYLGTEISGRPDSFYVVEVEKSSYGDLPSASLADDPASGRFVRTAVIEDKLRLTAQWGRTAGPVRVRFGLFESAFGIGADAILLGGRLKLDLDVSGTQFSRPPQLKLAAALQVFESIYISAGIDDALQTQGTAPVVIGPDDVPVFLERYDYGRDPFIGISLRYTDEDLTQLLVLYGAVLFAAL